MGGAQVSRKHANFLVNTGSATAADMSALVSAVKLRVEECSGASAARSQQARLGLPSRPSQV